MKIPRDKKNRVFLSLMLAMLLTALWSKSQVQPVDRVAGFWGMLYPQYCFSQVEPQNEEDTEPKIKLSFRWLHGF